MTSMGSTFLIFSSDSAPHRIDVTTKLIATVTLSASVMIDGTVLGRKGAMAAARPLVRPERNTTMNMSVAIRNSIRTNFFG